MNHKKFKIKSTFYQSGQEDLDSYCRWLKNKNIVTLHLIENYLGFPVESDERLVEIKKIILDVSGDINRLPYNIFIEDDSDEKL